MPKIKKISMEEFLKEQERIEQRNIQYRKVLSTLTRDYPDVQSSTKLRKRYSDYNGEIAYRQRNDGFWYIILVGMNEQIGSFSSEKRAQSWAEQFIGRVY